MLTSGSLGPADLLLVVLLATAVTGALSRDVSSITDAFLMVATIVAWSFVVDIQAQLRLQGLEDVSQVAHAYVEHDGRLSVISKDGPGPQPRTGKAGVYR